MTMACSLAKEFGPKIRVNAICSCMIDTDFHNIFTKDEVRATVSSMMPVKQEGTPEEAANQTAFLASDQSSLMTGTSVDINGGICFPEQRSEKEP